MSGGGYFVDGLGGEIPVCLSTGECHSSGHEQATVLKGLLPTSDRSLFTTQALVSATKAKVFLPTVAPATGVVHAHTTTNVLASREPSSVEPTCMVAAEDLGGLHKEIQ